MKKLLSFALTLFLALTLTACGGGGTSQPGPAASGSQAAGSGSQGAEPASVTTYRIATEGAYAPFNCLDENGQPDGYDIAVAKAVDELIDEVQFEYQAVEWSSIFAGLEAERYDLIVSQAAKTPEREEKYVFSDTAYTWDIGSIAFQAGRTDIQRMDDLAGKTVSVAVGSSNANILETWNAAHGNVVNIVYGDGEISKALLDVQEGRIDATLVNPVVGALVAGEQGLGVEFVLRSDAAPNPIYWLFADTEANAKLKPLVDEALQTLLANGTLSKISKEYLGDDYSSKEAVLARVPVAAD